MHFSIPETEDLIDSGGVTFVGYHIHLNGAHHCTVRYKQLRHLYLQICEECGPGNGGVSTNIPSFPSRSLLTLSTTQFEERRLQLEKFIHQDPRIMNSALFTSFLQSAQRETQNVTGHNVTLVVRLLDGKSIDLSFPAMVEVHAVLQALGERLEIPESCLRHFSLFFEQELDDGSIAIVRKLQDFECPYILEQTISGPLLLVLRVCYWERDWDDILMAQPSTLHLLYIQAVSDLKRNWVFPTPEERKLLKTYSKQQSKKKFVDCVRTAKFYGSLHFVPCQADFPHSNTKVHLCAANKELVFRFPDSKDDTKDMAFKVTRMRCWRITTAAAPKDNSQFHEPQLELSFEYLIGKDKLQWICVKSPQAILISLCLQEMVDELLEKKSGSVKCKVDRNIRPNWSYMKRDGTVHKLANLDGDNVELATTQEDAGISNKQSVQSIIGHLLGMNNSTRRKTVPRPVVENGAFQHIGDDDL